MSDSLAEDGRSAVRAEDTELTAGGLLKQARQAQGLHIAALAAAIKVAPNKLDMLESDRFDELPDATFTRALAQTVCRTLKIDPEPVLAKLPQSRQAHRLEQVTRGLNEPFRDRNSRHSDGFDWGLVGRPTVWGPLLLLLAAGAIYFVPPGAWRMPQLAKPGEAASAPAAEGATSVTTTLPAVRASAPAAMTPAAVEPAAASAAEVSAAQPAASAASSQASAANPIGVLVVRTSGESWVEVRDAGGQLLLSRLLMPGEAVGLDGAVPLRVKVGNVGATQLSFRGKPVELVAPNRDNVAKLELK